MKQKQIAFTEKRDALYILCQEPDAPEAGLVHMNSCLEVSSFTEPLMRVNVLDLWVIPNVAKAIHRRAVTAGECCAFACVHKWMLMVCSITAKCRLAVTVNKKTTTWSALCVFPFL